MKLPSDADALYTKVIEPMFGPLNGERVPWKTLRAKLPAAQARSNETTRLVSSETTTYRGSLTISGGLELEDGVTFLVLGDLTIEGGAWLAVRDYSLLLVGGKLAVDKLYTRGDVIAFGGIRANLWWGARNDHSTYTPSLSATTYIASEDRGDVIDKLTAKTKLVGFDIDAKLKKPFPKLDPKDEASIRALVGPAQVVRPAGRASASELSELRGRIGAALEVKDRTAHVKALRAVYAIIKKRKLAALGEALVAVIDAKSFEKSDWSLQDELELLAYLGRADLLEALPKKKLRGYESWIPRLLDEARER